MERLARLLPRALSESLFRSRPFSLVFSPLLSQSRSLAAERFDRFRRFARLNRPGHRPGLRSGRRPGLFSHLHALRKLVPCLPPKLTHEATARLPRLEPALPADARPLQSTAPAFMRVSLNTGINQEAAKRAPVRVYHSASRLIMVGTFDAVCRMIDHCIEEERVAMQHAAALK